ncbi:hypothetical protein OBBRIDRAFT_804456 [Obba rivulosa]|uniref:Uncharacterized protein n=1 Tax=Obba rivulosa TaxID=1052685 RepID=A0A8E2AX85_9APHY|nr:hypothetical protein OBBRIDRAFT_804456 [Obba rivulosa]
MSPHSGRIFPAIKRSSSFPQMLASQARLNWRLTASRCLPRGAWGSSPIPAVVPVLYIIAKGRMTSRCRINAGSTRSDGNPGRRTTDYGGRRRMDIRRSMRRMERNLESGPPPRNDNANSGWSHHRSHRSESPSDAVAYRQFAIFAHAVSYFYSFIPTDRLYRYTPLRSTCIAGCRAHTGSKPASGRRKRDQHLDKTSGSLPITSTILLYTSTGRGALEESHMNQDARPIVLGTSPAGSSLSRRKQDMTGRRCEANASQDEKFSQHGIGHRSGSDRRRGLMRPYGG